MEKVYLEQLIHRTKGNIQDMLAISKLSRSHFYALLKRHNIGFKA
jgi:two-component system NtrC family response regulator